MLVSTSSALAQDLKNKNIPNKLNLGQKYGSDLF